MATNYPKFDKKISDMITSAEMQKSKTRFGVIASYNKDNNTAKVLLEDRYSDQITDVLSDVPLPMSQRNTNGCSRSRNKMRRGI
jgi:hypothetical protein